MQCPQCSSSYTQLPAVCDPCGYPLEALALAPSPELGHQFVEIFSTQEPAQQTFIRSLLEWHGIRAVETNYSSSGHLSLYVRSADVPTARLVIEDHRHKTRDLASPRMAFWVQVFMFLILASMVALAYFELRKY